MIPTRTDAYQLLHEGAIALSRVQSNGIKIDTQYLSQTIDEKDAEIEQLESELKQTSLWRKKWKTRFGERSNLGARAQLGTVLFEVMGIEVKEHTKTKKNKKQVTASVLEQIDHPFVKKYLRIEKLKKMTNTFLRGIQNEVASDGRCHASYSLNIARTYRSSSSDPNSQNWPIRDPEMAEAIRQSFIADDDCHIVEVDYGQIEVRVAACYNHDPVLIEYIEDQTKDMHRDMAMEIFKIPETVPADTDLKLMRFFTKNQFVFPQFYGSYYVECAKNLWDSMLKNKFMMGSQSVRSHLKSQGIRSRGACETGQKPTRHTFEWHIKEVEKKFWDRFSVYSQWKRDWFNAYCRQGYYDTLTGFRIGGTLKRNDAINYGIQGSAFHCLLWSLITLQKLLMKRRMRSKVIGQIHDSIIAEVPSSELDEFLALAKRVMTIKIKKHWDWIEVPLEVEAEVAPAGGSWHQKKEVAI
jgi:DNA polymerase-1